MRCSTKIICCHLLLVNLVARPPSNELRAGVARVAVDAPHYPDFCARNPRAPRAKVVELVL